MTIIEKLVFLGTGCSTCIPDPLCISKVNSPKPQGGSYSCKVCLDAFKNNFSSKNKRNNVSLLIKLKTNKIVLIDCGKSFYQATMDLLRIGFDLHKIDAVLLTHAHADAYLGLDDLRSWSYINKAAIPIYLDQNTYKAVNDTFPYLINSSLATGGGSVASLEFRIIKNKVAFDVFGLDFLPMEVEHGYVSNGNVYTCLGFKFEHVLYVSDISQIPSKEIMQKATGTKILIVDCLKIENYSSHFGFNKSMQLVNMLGPEKAYLVGMSHHLDHNELYEMCGKHAKENLNGKTLIEPAYDGLCIEL